MSHMSPLTYKVISPACNHPAASDAESFGLATWLWMHAPKHNVRPLYALDQALMPAIELGQYVIVIETNHETGAVRPVGYLSWANLTPEAEARYVQNPIQGLGRGDWNSGERMWLVDFVAPFGHAARVHATWRPLLATSSARFMYHRSHERGVEIRLCIGIRAQPHEARQWWAERPILAA